MKETCNCLEYTVEYDLILSVSKFGAKGDKWVTLQKGKDRFKGTVSANENKCGDVCCTFSRTINESIPYKYGSVTNNQNKSHSEYEFILKGKIKIKGIIGKEKTEK